MDANGRESNARVSCRLNYSRPFAVEEFDANYYDSGGLRLIDGSAGRPYTWIVQTTVDIDKGLLRRLEQQARREGKSLDAYLNQTLREVVQDSEPG